jgi:diguanylate cyclase (GGDEF)-like protein
MIDCETAALVWLERRFDCRAAASAATFESLVSERFAHDPAMTHMAAVVHGAAFPEDMSTAESAGLRLSLTGASGLDIDSAAAFDHACFLLDALLESARARIAAGEPVVSDPLLEPVSGLPDRLLFRDRLEQAIANAHRRDSELALCIVQFDFANIEGDLPRILRELADRLKHSVREVDTVARIGRDEFAIVITSLRRRLDASHALQTTWEMTSEPFDVGDRCYQVPVRIGVAFYPAHGHEPDSLLESARTAAATADPVRVFGEEEAT